MIDLPNNHLQYAITWYALAVALVVVYIVAGAPPPGRTHVTPSPYHALEARFRRLGALREAGSVLHWDIATMMPEGGAGARAEQLATLQVVCHEHAERSGAARSARRAPTATDDLDPWQRANLREMRRQWLHATARAGRSRRGAVQGRRASARWRGARRGRRAISPSSCRRCERLLALVREVAAAQGRAARQEPLRGAARPVRARRQHRRDRSPVRPSRARCCPA